MNQYLLLILSALLISSTSAISFPLAKGKETCFYIQKAGEYEFEFIVSGEQPSKYQCTIYSSEGTVDRISEMTEYEGKINFTNSENRICFAPLDNLSKQISFDIISTEDPLLDHFSEKEERQTHQKMFLAFQKLEKVYRDQHMLLERSAVYQNILENRQFKIIFILLFKIIIGAILGAYQLLLIKEIVSKKTYGYSLPTDMGNDDDDQF